MRKMFFIGIIITINVHSGEEPKINKTEEDEKNAAYLNGMV